MSRSAGLGSEVLASLALVMGLATVVLVAISVAHQELTLRRTLGPALLAEARQGPRPGVGAFPGTAWWRLEAATLSGAGGPAPADEELLALAREARVSGEPLLRTGWLAEPIRFAAPMGGGVVAARLPEGVSHRLRVGPLSVVLGIAFANLTIFTAFGALLLRRRVVRPLETLSVGARRIAEGDAAFQVAVDGPRETQEVATSFNEMTAALSARGTALEKAVRDLRASNRELREARLELDRAERLGMVGRLSAGVAHEVGNPIGAILAFLELASREPGLSEDGRKYVERAASEAERVRRILRQLLDFARPARPRREAVELTRLAEETAELVRAQSRYRNVTFEVRPEASAGPALADPALVSQILLNLLLNAGDALEGVEGAWVRIVVRAPAERRGAEPVGDVMDCVVSDNGPGIPVELRERIFHPFFTTRDPGKGTGLGLSTASRQAQEMGGDLSWTPPEDGAATSFRLRLPAPTDARAETAVRSSGAERA